MENNLLFPVFLRKNLSGIYAIQNRTSGKIYVGSSCDIRRRLTSHYSKLKRGIHKNRYLQEDFNKLGIYGFLSKVLMRCNPNNLLEWEQYFLDFPRPPMYNIVKLADGSILPEETKQRISKGLLGNKNTKGCKLTENHKQKLSLSLKGRKMSPETRERMRTAKLGKPSNAKGKHWKVTK